MHSLTHWPGYGGIASLLHRISIIEFRECESLQQHDFPEREVNTACICQDGKSHGFT